MSSSPKNTDAAVICGAAAVSLVAALALIGLPESRSPVPAAVKSPAVVAKAPPLPPTGGLPFPVEVEVAFALTDHDGNEVTERDFLGRPMLLFFGYSTCESICTVALPQMGAALDHLGDEGEKIAAVMVTVDPARDTPQAMRKNLPHWHDRLLGLTGSEAELARVRDRFHVDLEVVAEDPLGNPIYAHGSFVYLIGADGELKTMIPPILAPERIAELAKKYF
ncbi:SCO family protein [Rhodobacteraceae bacterium NNCM2]|nr:SCO family protein [Coraliihabitans acroporae]